MNKELFSSSEALTFDDVLIVPAYSEVLPSETDIRTRLTRQIKLNIPVLSAAMDTVTEAKLAIALARAGGIGILHRNLSPKEQAEQVDRVKRWESGMILDPITLAPDATLQEAEDIMARFHISGLPVVVGTEKRLIGIITNRDTRFTNAQDMNRPVSDFMTERNLITASVGTTLEEAREILQKYRIEKLPLVDASGLLKGLITVKDIQKRSQYPNAAKDGNGRLLVGAAVGVGADLEERLEKMTAKGLDVVVVDTAHGHTAGVIGAVQRIKRNWPELPVIAGNVVTAQGTRDLVNAGADAVKVGVGAGSICTTRVVAGAGMPQLTAVYNCAQEGAKYDVPVIADGGIKYSGEVVKALAAGAESVMLGSLLAGLDETPGEVVLYEGRRYKEYRGMGSVAALQGYGRDRYGSGQSGPGKLVPEGVEGIVPFKGTLADFIDQLIGGLHSGMGYAGARDIAALRTQTNMVRITNAGLVESHPHDITITREAPNYRRRE